MSTEAIEQRFGTVAERRGYITPTQLVEALKIQVFENIKKRQHRFIGEILYDQGHITTYQINEVLDFIATFQIDEVLDFIETGSSA